VFDGCCSSSWHLERESADALEGKKTEEGQEMKALVLGCRGQLGHYLCAYLKAKGYEVIGTTSALFDETKDLFEAGVRVRPPTLADLRADSLCDVLVPGINFLDVVLYEALVGVLAVHGPFDEIYNLAGLLSVPKSWDAPAAHMQVNGTAVGTLLDVILRNAKNYPSVFIAGSAEVFGNQLTDQAGPYRRSTDVAPTLLTERSPRYPQSPYGLSKFVAEATARMYRERYNMCVSTGIFFNVESPRRRPDFFARKVALEAARVARDAHAGNPIKPVEFAEPLNAVRDWGLASEYAAAVWQMTAAPSGECGVGEYIICSGHFASCQEFAIAAVEAALAEVNIIWPRKMILEEVLSVPTNPTKDAPQSIMRGSNAKFSRAFGWAPRRGYLNVVRELVHAELAGGPWEHPLAGVGV
jgi:GDPmannose 4,6-dehydratase